MFLLRINDRLTRILMIAAAVWAFTLTFIIMSDIIGRGVYNRPVYGVREIVMNSIVIIVFLQAAYAIRSGSMLRATFLTDIIPSQLRRAFAVIGYLLGAGFFFTIVSGSIGNLEHAWVSNEFEGEGALRVPTWPTHFMILVGGTLAGLNYLILVILEIFRPDLLNMDAYQKTETVN